MKSIGIWKNFSNTFRPVGEVWSKTVSRLIIVRFLSFFSLLLNPIVFSFCSEKNIRIKWPRANKSKGEEERGGFEAHLRLKESLFADFIDQKTSRKNQIIAWEKEKNFNFSFSIRNSFNKRTYKHIYFLKKFLEYHQMLCAFWKNFSFQEHLWVLLTEKFFKVLCWRGKA